MGRIEETFGSQDAAQEFMMYAHGQPILRLKTEHDEFQELPGHLHDETTFAAHSGFVTGELIEPEADGIPNVCLGIEPVSFASHSEGQVERLIPFRPMVVVWPSTNLRLMNPVHDPTRLEENFMNFKHKSGNVGLTVVGHSLIMATLELVDDNANCSRRFEVLSALARPALRGVWEKPTPMTE